MSDKMPDLYEAFKSTEQKYGLDEAVRQWNEAAERMDSENRSFRAMLIRGFFAVVAIAIFFGVFL